MKMNGLHYMGFAAALLGGTMLCSCSSDEPDAAVNPTYNGETVKTTFAISVPTTTTGTRMQEDIVQNTGNFRGLDNIKLFPYVTDMTGMTGISLENFKNYSKQYSVETSSRADGGYKLYSNVAIPVGTKNFLLYATASREDGVTNFTDGTLTATGLDGAAASGISFKPTLIVSDKTDLVADEATMVSYLNNIAAQFVWDDDTKASQALVYSYRALTALKAGSASAIKYFLNDLYKKMATLTPSNAADAGSVAKVAYNVQQAIIGTSYAQVNGSELSWTNTTLPNIPDKYNLPQGCLRLDHVEGTGFSYGVFVSTNPSLTFDKICYPAELYYFVDSPARANTNDEITWPSSLANWYGETWTGWTEQVDATSHTVAVKDPVNYSVAQLQTRVTCAAAKLTDNEHAYDNTVPDNNISVPSTGFAVTGILVGGQPTGVDYKFDPASDAAFDQVIFDKTMATVTKTDAEGNETVTTMTAKQEPAWSNINYTLVLDNLVDGDQNDVLVAIEFVNGDEEFYGVDGKIGKGQKFYLVGELKVASGTGTLPSEVTKRVFLKDYVTKADFTITSLKNAYGTIPDLEKSQLQLGMAVDLYWQQGLTFEVEL